jgi:hypothetical protein
MSGKPEGDKQTKCKLTVPFDIRGLINLFQMIKAIDIQDDFFF